MNISPADSFGVFVDGFMICAQLWAELHDEEYLAYRKCLKQIKFSPAAIANPASSHTWVLVIEESWEPGQPESSLPQGMVEVMSALAFPDEMQTRKFIWNLTFACESATEPHEWKFLGAEVHESGGQGLAPQGDAWVQEALALREDVLGQYKIAYAYSVGEGLAQNDELAFHWYDKAARQGPSKWQDDVEDMFGNGSAAKCNLADMYENGVGVAQNYELALYWYKQAAAQDNPVAHYSLGVMYKNGSGAEKDLAQAAAYFRQAADQAYEPADLELAQMG